jgi:hypothetical protein
MQAQLASGTSRSVAMCPRKELINVLYFEVKNFRNLILEIPINPKRNLLLCGFNIPMKHKIRM